MNHYKEAYESLQNMLETQHDVLLRPKGQCAGHQHTTPDLLKLLTTQRA